MNKEDDSNNIKLIIIKCRLSVGGKKHTYAVKMRLSRNNCSGD